MSLNQTISRKLETKKSMKAVSRKISFSGPILRQQWALHDSLIYYIVKNPSSPKIFQKLVNTCKYFYAKNAVLVIQNFRYNVCSWETTVGNLPHDLINIKCRFWITSQFRLEKTLKNPYYLSSIISKIHQCDVKNLHLSNQIISYNDFRFLSSSAEDIYFNKVTVKNDDGSIVSFEKIIEFLPKAKWIKFACDQTNPSFTSKTAKKIAKLLPQMLNLKDLCLHDTPETFNLNAFYGYMKKNKQTSLWLEFDDSISKIYKNQLEAIVDEIIDTEEDDYKIPYINFPGLSSQKRMKLFQIRIFNTPSFFVRNL